MADYRVAVKPSARKELEQLPAHLIARVIARLERLGSNPRPPDCKKLKGGDAYWRIRMGDYRVVYTIDDAQRVVQVTRIRYRGKAYE